MPFQWPQPCRLFLFDLDGTLIDSKTDIAVSLNLALIRMNLRPIPLSRAVDFVGDGVLKLVERTLRETLGHDAEEVSIRAGTALFQEEYSNHLMDSTFLYPGVQETLDQLSWAKFAVVSNKPEKFSRQILKVLQLDSRFEVILGGDSISRRKPDPAPLLTAMTCCSTPPHETVMVGDSAIDVAAGKAAGVITCGVGNGFGGNKELVAAGCDLIIPEITELPRYFCSPGTANTGG
jgi:phosphoglycolate phosphatase